jgi:cytochrome P450
LGFPEEDQDRLREWTDAQIHREENNPNLPPEGQRAFEHLLSYYLEQVQLRRDTPRDDIVTDLLHAELVEQDGSTRYLHDGELLTFIAMINVAGNETVARLLGWAALVLARYPNERAKLVANTGLIPNAVEELLRYEAPSPVQGRFATRDVVLHGYTIPAGSKVALLTGSAGRDEREYPDPDVFKVERSNIRHLSFGHSAHFCLGAALARLEACIALEETLARFPAWTVDEKSIEFVHTNSVRGPAAVPIALR